MEMTVSEKGQLVIPGALSRRLGLKSGDKVEAAVKNGEIVLSPQLDRKRKATVPRIVQSPITGLPVIDVGEDAPILTSEMVREMLADFP